MKSVDKGGLSSSGFVVESKVHLMQKPCRKLTQPRPHVVSSRRIDKKPFTPENFMNSGKFMNPIS